MLRRAVVFGAALAPFAAMAQSLPAGITQRDGAAALKEALQAGAIAAVTRVARLDGYWGDGAIRIPLPDSLARAQRTLKGLGLSAPLDDLHLKMNRAAETAAPAARQLFANVIRSLTIEDVAGVLRGGPTGGTDLLRAKTTAPLTASFTPPISDALAKTGAFTALDRVAAAQGLALGDKPRRTVTKFTVEKALGGLFHYVGEEEKAIRADPARRTTQILRSVFGRL